MEIETNEKKSGWSAGNQYTFLIARQLALFLDCEPTDLVSKFAQLEDYLNVASCWMKPSEEKEIVNTLSEIESLVFPNQSLSKEERVANRVKAFTLINETLRKLNRHYKEAGLLTPQKEDPNMSIFG